MEYDKLKKEELIKMLQDQKHLAKAVESKDSEISGLKSEMASSISKVKKDKQDEIIFLEEKVKNLEGKLKESPDIEKVKKIVQENQVLIEAYNKMRIIFNNYLKSTQATLENTLELEYTVAEKVKNSFGGE